VGKQIIVKTPRRNVKSSALLLLPSPGHRHGLVLALPRPASRIAAGEPTCLASESNKPGRRDFAAFCELQGLPRSFDLPAFTLSAKYRAVGNGVHLDVARLLARGVASPVDPAAVRLCACGCARPVSSKALSAGPGCRKRLERKRDAAGMGQVRMVTPRLP